MVVDAYPVQFKQATESKQSHLFVIGTAGTGKSTFAQRFSEGRIVFGTDMISYGPKGFAFTRENAKVDAAIARSLLAQTQARVVFTYAGKASSFEVAVKGHGRRVPNSEIIVLGEILSKAHAHSVLESTKTRRRQLHEVVTLPGFEVFIKPPNLPGIVCRRQATLLEGHPRCSERCLEGVVVSRSKCNGEKITI